MKKLFLIPLLVVLVPMAFIGRPITDWVLGKEEVHAR